MNMNKDEAELFRRCADLGCRISGGDFRVYQMDDGKAWRVGFGGVGYVDAPTLAEALALALKTYAERR